MNPLTIMWILTGLNAGMFIASELKYRALYKGYVDLLEKLRNLLNAEKGALQKLRDLVRGEEET